MFKPMFLMGEIVDLYNKIMSSTEKKMTTFLWTGVGGDGRTVSVLSVTPCPWSFCVGLRGSLCGS